MDEETRGERRERKRRKRRYGMAVTGRSVLVLARQAVPDSKPEDLLTLTISEWERTMGFK